MTPTPVTRIVRHGSQNRLTDLGPNPKFIFQGLVLLSASLLLVLP